MIVTPPMCMPCQKSKFGASLAGISMNSCGASIFTRRTTVLLYVLERRNKYEFCTIITMRGSRCSNCTKIFNADKTGVWDSGRVVGDTANKSSTFHMSRRNKRPENKTRHRYKTMIGGKYVVVKVGEWNPFIQLLPRDESSPRGQPWSTSHCRYRLSAHSMKKAKRQDAAHPPRRTHCCYSL